MAKNKGLLKLAKIWKNNLEIVKTMKNIYKSRKNFKLRNYTILE